MYLRDHDSKQFSEYYVMLLDQISLYQKSDFSFSLYNDDRYRGEDPVISTDGTQYYISIFDSLDRLISSDNYVTDSLAIDESEMCGEYDYHLLKVFPNTLVLYMDATHPEVYPLRCIIFNMKYRIDINGDNRLIDVCPTPDDLLCILMTDSSDEQIKMMLEWLKSTDRPSIAL